MEVRLVPYSESLKESLFCFTAGCFEELGKKFEPDGRHGFYNDIENEFDVFYCLVLDEEVIGTVGLKKVDVRAAGKKIDEGAVDLKNDECTVGLKQTGARAVELKAMYLDRSYRGKGYGRMLMDKAVEEAKRLGYECIVLDSMSKYEDALRLYERAGFRRIERYNDNIHADVFMRLDL